MKPLSRFRTPGLLAAFGLLGVALLAVNNSLRERVVVRHAEAARQVAEVRTRLATLHLWVEEYVSGDTVDLDEVATHKQRSREILTALSDEGEGGAAFSLAGDEEAIGVLARVRPLVDEFVGLSRERLDGFDRGEPVGVGSAIDVRYDGVFYALLNELRVLDDLVLSRLDAAHQRSRTLFTATLLAWIGLLALSIAAIWRFERRREEAEAALRASEAALLQAQKMEAVGSLAGGLAHDINNYLAAISAQCEVVRMKSEDEVLAGKMTLVLDTCKRASSLLDRLLAFSRGKAEVEQVVDLNRIVHGISEMSHRLVGETIDMELDLEPGIWPVEVSVSQIEQALVNLIVNARDAMADGGRIRIETRNAGDSSVDGAPAGDFVRLRVSDTGEGVSAEVADKIFEPFFTTRGKSRHSGLGLSTVYAVARQHGGTVRLVEGAEGATFELLVPRSTVAPTTAEEVDATAVPLVHEGTILLVEDNETLRGSTRELLETMGYEVEAAADGGSALSIFEKSSGRFDLLLTDVILPGLNGRELADRVREISPSMPVLFASGYTDSVILRSGIDESAINFLPKPYSADALESAIARVLAPRPEARGPR